MPKSSSFAVKLAQKTGARLNVFHISTALELNRDNSIELNDKNNRSVCSSFMV